jgi:FAD:protein FMN transferase
MTPLNSERFLHLFLFMLLNLVLSSCSQKAEETVISGEAQGTTYHIKFVLNVATMAKVGEFQIQVMRRLDEIDKTISNYRPDSEISSINQQETTEWISVSPEIISLIAISKTVYEKSSGCFDLTIKPLFDLWGFFRHKPKIPKLSDIESIKQHIGMSLLEFDQDKMRLRKKDPQLKIDLASIA